MDSEIQAQISVDASKALAAYDALTAKQVKLNRAVEAGNRAAKDYQKTVSKNFRDAGQAAGRAGGPLGTAGSQILGSAGMDSSFGRLGVAVGLVAFGFRALTSVVDSRIAREREVIEQTRKLGDALEGAGKQAGKRGLSAVPFAQQVRSLEATGGSVQDAQRIADQIGARVEDVVSGMIEIRRNARTREEVQAATREASILFRAGKTSFAEGAAGVTKGGTQRAMLGGEAGEAGASYLRSKGEQATAAQLTVTSPMFLRRSSLVPKLDEMNRLENQKTMSGLSAIQSGEAGAELRDEVARMFNPSAVAIAEWNKGVQQNIETLKQLEKYEGSVVRIFRNIAMVFGGEGSIQNQRMRAQNVAGDVQFGANSPLRGDE